MGNTHRQSVRRAVRRGTKTKDFSRQNEMIGHVKVVRDWLKAGRVEAMADRLDRVLMYLYEE